MSAARTAHQNGYLFEMPPSSTGVREYLSTWQARLGALQDLGRERGGLVPRSILPEVLDISRQRVKDLIDKQQLEVIHFYGAEFVSGRSIQQWKEGVHAGLNVGGRGHKRHGLWRSLVIGAKLGKALSDAADPDR